jgi:Bacterial Ig domain/Secretion system C-terminal sorting domain
MLKGAFIPIFLSVAALPSAGVSYAQSHFTGCEDGAGNIFNSTLIIPAQSVAEFNGLALSPGSEIAVFKSGAAAVNNCVGVTSWTGQSEYVVIWADDPATGDEDGLKDGERFEIKVYDDLSGLEYGTEFIRHQFISGDAVFTTDGVYILSALSAPVFEGAPRANDDQFVVLEDEQTELDILANDNRGDAGNLSILGLSTSRGSAQLNPTRDAVLYTPEPNWSGSAVLTYAIKDSDGRIDGATARIEVEAVNDAPTISGSPLGIVTEAEPYSFVGTIEDIDGDELSVTAVLLPDWLVLSRPGDNQFEIAGRPGVTDTGEVTVHVQVSDGSAVADLMYDIVVRAAITPPQRPALLEPAHQSANIAVGVQFKWEQSLGSSNNRIQITRSTDFTFQDAQLDDTTVDIFLDVDSGLLKPETSYIWRVQAQNSAGVSQWSPIFLFSTGIADPTATDVETGAGIPKTVYLDQNYPNPFNPSTTIPFGLPAATHTRLEIFDLLGRSQAVLVDRVLAAGTHQVTWNAGRNASGIYIYRLTTNNTVHTGTLSLLK